MKLTRKFAVVVASMALMLQLPLVALADDAAPTDTGTPPAAQTTTPPDSGSTTTTTDPAQTASTPAPGDASQSGSGATTPPTSTSKGSGRGPRQPNGSDSGQYSFNPATGMWESSLYVWNPATKQTMPKNNPGYSYDPATGMWNTTQYVYHPESGTYQPVAVSSPVAPAASGSSAQGSGAGDQGAMLATLAQMLGNDPAISNTGPNSTNSVVENSTNNGFFNLFSKAVIDNNLNSQATSGDASVTGNTNGGSATTGPAQVVANLLNLLNSSLSWSTGGLSTFVENLFGNQTGNLLLQPATATGGGGSLGTAGTTSSNTGTGPNSTNTIDTNNANNLNVNSQASGTINNNLNLLAQSGNAGVNGNTNGGNATSGNANVDLNILNLINSAIGSGQSFLGVVNVFGNLDGNILFPQGFLDGVAAASGDQTPTTTASNTGTGPGSTNGIGVDNTNNANITNANQATINNNIKDAAQSGSANVANNTLAGSATTGTAATKTDTFNYSGNLTADNAVLVLVNVLGHWVGAILNLPSTGNSQAALLTGGATNASNTNTGPNSTNQINATNSNNTNITSANTGTINNNINAGAISGDANVSDNTKAGNATSGNASVAADVVNFVGSTLNIKHWFGVLMINVFGDWNGSVTTATPETASIQPQGVAAPADAKTSQANTGQTSHTSSSGSGGSNNTVTQDHQASSNLNLANTKVLSAKQTAATTQTRQIAIWVLVAAALMLISGMMISLERKLGRTS